MFRGINIELHVIFPHHAELQAVSCRTASRISFELHHIGHFLKEIFISNSCYTRYNRYAMIIIIINTTKQLNEYLPYFSIFYLIIITFATIIFINN